VVYAKERGKPKKKNRTEKLITPIYTFGRSNDAKEKLQWYALRWKIEISQGPEVCLQSGRVQAADC
jgi:hypothetical protein